jgi:hypothetical protein
MLTLQNVNVKQDLNTHRILKYVKCNALLVFITILILKNVKKLQYVGKIWYLIWINCINAYVIKDINIHKINYLVEFLVRLVSNII